MTEATMAPVTDRKTRGRRQNAPPPQEGRVSNSTGMRRVIVILCSPPSRCVTFYKKGKRLFLFEGEVRTNAGPEEVSEVVRDIFIGETTLKVEGIEKMLTPDGTLVIACRSVTGNCQLVNNKDASVSSVWPGKFGDVEGCTWRDSAHEAAFTWAISKFHQ